MRNTLVLFLLAILLFNCSKKEDPQACGCDGDSWRTLVNAKGKVVLIDAPSKLYSIQVDSINLDYKMIPCDSSLFKSKFKISGLQVVISGGQKNYCSSGPGVDYIRFGYLIDLKKINLQ